ncbi:hypothetical protein, partial [Pseudooceanicola nanhaiensis]|uniref:hypothetical protein n=1 Tax=Pseudooceanicola nanhaiensis TaxID=375761 RepID=UPI001CD1FD73
DAADRLASPFKCVQQAEGLLFDIRRRHVSTNRRLPFSTSGLRTEGVNVQLGAQANRLVGVS